MATDYDKGTTTERERLAAKRQNAIAEYNAKAVQNQLNQQLNTYDFANKQNASLRDSQIRQNKTKSDTDRFEAQRQLQKAALSLFGAMGPSGMNSSTMGNAMRMLEDRNDSENNVYWQELQDNLNSVWNSYNESYAQNQAAKRDAWVNANKAMHDIQSDLSANLSNINPNLYKEPGKNENLNKIQKDINSKLNTIKASDATANAKAAGYYNYIMPARERVYRSQKYDEGGKVLPTARNKMLGNSYFAQLMNRFNGK